jgi:hypothetical protein
MVIWSHLSSPLRQLLYATQVIPAAWRLFLMMMLFRFEAWLTARNRKVQRQTWERFKKGNK